MNMEHYYVISGNEYGADIYSKRNFSNIDDARDCFEEHKFDDFACVLVHVNSYGVEDVVEQFIDEES